MILAQEIFTLRNFNIQTKNHFPNDKVESPSNSNGNETTQEILDYEVFDKNDLKPF